MADGAYIRGCLEFLCGKTIEHFALVDNTTAKQIANQKGVGKIRHLAGKVLWIQEYTASGKIKVFQIPTDLNLADVGTKPLSMARTKALLYCMVWFMEKATMQLVRLSSKRCSASMR